MSNNPSELNKTNKPSLSVLFGAAFLMATSAIGPGFMTQTSKFTAEQGAKLILVILLVICMDIIAQMNIWSTICVANKRAQDIANTMLPGLGVFIAILVAIGGLAFNVGNCGGVALGFNAMFGIPEKIGSVIAGALGILIFANKSAKTVMDKVSTALAAIILGTILVVAIISKPPVGDVVGSFSQIGEIPSMFTCITTLLGGSCGGYIAFSGAHRLMDAGTCGVENVGNARRSVLMGCCTSGVVRILLFLAVLGTCTAGGVWIAENADAIANAGNPAAEAFRLAAGTIGYKMFGLCLFSAGISSVVGAAFTSVSFLKTLHPFIGKNEKWFVIGFITFSTIIAATLGNAGKLLVLAGAVNGLILPITLGTMLLASRNKKIVGENYKHPVWMTVLGFIVFVLAAYIGIKAVPGIMNLFK